MAPSTPEDHVRRVWESRHAVELAASARFESLAHRMSRAGVPRAVVALSERAAGDEVRHAGHCQTVVSRHGGGTLSDARTLYEYAPRELDTQMRLVYEVTAQSCIAETESMSTLLVLLDAAESPELREILHELARDEVNHSRLGWAFLAWARDQMSLASLGEMLPSMLEGNSGNGIFAAPRPEENDDALLRFGVVPAHLRREVYVKTLEDVVFPGFESLGVDTAPSRAWLGTKLLKD